MGVQRFTGANTRETMRQIRQALGEDVLILSNRVVDGGVEIVAMSEQAHAQALAGPAGEGESDGTPASESAAAESPAAWEAFNRRMLEDMRALLRESAAPAPAPGQAVRDAILRQLSQAGFSHVLCETLLETLPASLLDESAEEAETPAWQAWLERQLAARLEVLDSEEALFEAGGLFALVGPTGAGKTTTTAKLAARYVMRHGPREAALVTTDSYRIGAAEQLRIYARLLGVEVHALDEQGDLGALLGRLAQPRRGLMGRSGGKRMMVIDTVGMSQRDQRLMGEIARLGAAPVSVRRLLVLDAARHGDTLEQVVEAWQRASQEAGEPLWGCILTKLDEAARLGPVLDVLMRHGLKLCYLSRGQRVPEDLEPVDREALLREALDHGGESPFSRAAGSAPAAPAQARQQALSQGVLRQGEALETMLATLRRQVQGMPWLEHAWPCNHGTDSAFAARLMSASRQAGLRGEGAPRALWWSKPAPVRGQGQAMPLVALDAHGMPQPLVWPRHELPAGDEARFAWADSLGAEWHLLNQLPDVELLAGLDVQRRSWLAATSASRRVRHSGEWLRLDEALALGEAQPGITLFHRGRQARLDLKRLETTLAKRRGDGEGLPVIAWEGTWHDEADGRQLGRRFWIGSARTGFDSGSRLAAALALEGLPSLTQQAERLLKTRRPELEERAHRWQLAAALAALALHLAQAEAGWATDVRARLSDIAQRRCGRRPKALLEGLMDALSAHQTLRRAKGAGGAATAAEG
ncbi:flagellar biosynthesis protein FlhF [Salinicola sp. JS01]|uniref:flagellar biosynthesis protein FlhF n=1 Tax=Salinicola sp. JS01 TaxID=3050071 RepID=UPI00255BE0A1|nr:flagellar biosynthesis protein FlhF [Salinicola sp. JS01]WIX33581.1 flagellar biosynthesis protein FlhF [Salinicola sp. JS01]